jgi:alginate O-acetyltransferase complex protein AlgI
MFYFLDFGKITDLFSFDPYDPLLFTSALFLFLFFFILIVYRITSGIKIIRVLVLIAFSFFFYYKSNGLFFLLLLISSVFNYSSAIGLVNTKGLIRRILFIGAISINLLLLGYFKYTDFFISMINDVRTSEFQYLDIFLPVGISFYTFKVISYLTDVYWETMEPERNFLDLTLYITFFGNILAGPIDRASAFLPQVKKEYYISRQQISMAVLLIISGLIKKVVIADYLSLNFVDRVFEFPTRFSGVENLLAVYAYSLQIYCDFSGYTDLAIGISLLLGYHLMENFNFPYKATSVADFWRRWHISLSSWLADYLFRPLQMKFRNMRMAGNILALLITFVLCGFWHGASWTFIAWGFIHGFYMAFSLLTAKPRKRFIDLIGLSDTKILPIIQRIITFHLIAFAWIFFRAPSFEYAGDMLDQIFTFFHPEIFLQFLEGYSTVTLLILLGYALHFLPRSLEAKTVDFLSNRSLLMNGFLLALFIWVAIQVKSSDLQPFLYFQF